MTENSFARLFGRCLCRFLQLVPPRPAEKMLPWSQRLLRKAEASTLQKTRSQSTSPPSCTGHGQVSRRAVLTWINALGTRNPINKRTLSAVHAAHPAPGSRCRLATPAPRSGHPSRCTNGEFLGKIPATGGLISHPRTGQVN